jgi:hypothetical protein
VVEADRVAADLAEWEVAVLVAVDLVAAQAAIALSRCLVRWAAAVPALVAAIGR